ncbi:OPT oligopeptide transporter protein-domain-containing protein [Colletotrichum godetiae]|uniref:OPT oligopeptide transporter protein-domain-containing protein n=1 Tax=Colletotrichum godetiae TaxID=1209918 RepID=A0AAJ0ACJ8_9PEZI|nr:OPT oligopeptide transporter protein-domain-containing protein [Colletotrichum godetiae]KAK1659126.1 OPT oligopeptide transporter protein-domain-containing protein [Colletotrichum godetiae]
MSRPRDIEAVSPRHRRASDPRPRQQEAAHSASSLTLRSTVVGIIVGILICLSNTYFGLRTGFLAIMSLPSTILGFAFFKTIQDHLAFPFTPQEHATMVVIASSLGLMPFTIGSVGILPAMEFLTNESENGPFHLDWAQLCVWSIGVSILGVAVTLPLRKRFLVQEPLPFPFGTSSAAMIGSLHRDADIAHRILRAQNDLESVNDKQKQSIVEDSVDTDDSLLQHGWSQNNKLILVTFLFAALYSLTAYFIPQIRTINIFGNYLAQEWLFSLSTSPGYVSIGLIVPPITTLWIVVGCLIGWGILSPLSRLNGWAPGSVSDWETGSRGWIMWIAVALILGDTAVTLSTMLLRSFNVYAIPNLVELSTYWKGNYHFDDDEDTQPLIRGPLRPEITPQVGSLDYRDDKLTTKVYLIWILTGLLLCFASMVVLFGSSVPVLALLLAVFTILPLSHVNIRCYGETGTGGAAYIGMWYLFLQKNSA